MWEEAPESGNQLHRLEACPHRCWMDPIVAPAIVAHVTQEHDNQPGQRQR